MPFAVTQQHPRYRVSTPVAVINNAGDIEELSLEDISLGGVFIRTSRPPPPGSFVRMRLAIGSATPDLALMGRVVHVIDGDAGARKARAPGMGVQFDGLSPHSERLLRSFVEGIVEEERRRLAREAAVRLEEATPAPAQVDPRVRDEVLELLAEAEFLEGTGDHDEAKRALLDAAALAPDDADIGRRLDALHEAADAAQALALLAGSEAAAVDERVRAARRAVLLSSSHEVIVRALRVFAAAGAERDLIAAAEILLEAHPDDETALLTLFSAHEGAGRLAAAARAGEALLRVRPDDGELHDRIFAVIAAARR